MPKDKFRRNLLVSLIIKLAAAAVDTFLPFASPSKKESIALTYGILTLLINFLKKFPQVLTFLINFLKIF